MSIAHDKRRVTGIALAVVLVVLVVLWLRPDKPIRVEVTADKTMLSPGEAVAVVAKILDAAGNVNGSSACKVVWSTTDGTVSGTGRTVTWEAPLVAGSARVTARARCGSAQTEGSVDFTVSTVERDSLARGPEDKAAPSGALPAPEGDGPAPVIDEIKLEKTEVCRGETNLVTVKAHDPAGVNDAWLAIFIDGQPGASVPVPYVRGGLPLAKKIIVHGKDNKTQTIADIPNVVVKDCDVPRVVLLTWTQAPNVQDLYRFDARILPKGNPAPFTPESFEWDFGDGGGVVTEAPSAEHSYLERPQRSLASSFLVKLKIKSREGETADGRVAVTLRNTFFVERGIHKTSLLQIVMDPPFPERAEDGIVRQRARVRTLEPDPVTITKVTLQETVAGEDRPTQAVGPASLLGTTRVASTWLTVPLVLDDKRTPQLFMRRYTLEGEAADGTKVYGTISIMAPPRLDKDHNTPVTDDLEKRRIMAAMEILGKPQVTAEDLARLDEQGRLPRAVPSGAGSSAPASSGAARGPTAPTVVPGAVHHDPKAKL